MSDMSKAESGVVTGVVNGIKLNYGEKPTTEPKKITEQDITSAVKYVVREAREQRVEERLSPTANTIVESANATTLHRLKNLVPEKARHVLGLSVKKAALTACGLYLLISSGCGNIESPITSTSSPSALESQKPPNYEYLSFGNISVDEYIKVAVDKQGVPIKYVLADGTEVIFDRDEIRKIRKKAVSSNQPMIVKIIPINGTHRGEKMYSKEHPKTTELPEDVLSEEVLEKRGVRIVQTGNKKLFIREGAFANGAPLADFNNTGRKLTIILVDREEVNLEYYKLSNSEYEHIPEYLEIDMDKYKENKTASFKEAIHTFLTEGQYSHNTQRPRGDEYIIWLETELYKLEEASRIAFIDDALNENAQINLYPAFYLEGHDAKIVLAVGEPTEFVSFYFDSNGNFKHYFYDNFNVNRLPFSKYEESHPSPSDATLTPLARYGVPQEMGSYLYQKSHFGFKLRHEIAHDKGGEGGESEYYTDVKAMKGLATAWEMWEKSGFTDNSGYYFVFTLPGGGYILTEKPSSSLTAPSKL